jgi:hypothetical protein
MLFLNFQGLKEASLVVKYNVKSRHWMTLKIDPRFEAHMSCGLMCRNNPFYLKQILDVEVSPVILSIKTCEHLFESKYTR